MATGTMKRIGMHPLDLVDMILEHPYHPRAGDMVREALSQINGQYSHRDGLSGTAQAHIMPAEPKRDELLDRISGMSLAELYRDEEARELLDETLKYPLFSEDHDDEVGIYYLDKDGQRQFMTKSSLANEFLHDWNIGEFHKKCIIVGYRVIKEDGNNTYTTIEAIDTDISLISMLVNGEIGGRQVRVDLYGRSIADLATDPRLTKFFAENKGQLLYITQKGAVGDSGKKRKQQRHMSIERGAGVLSENRVEFCYCNQDNLDLGVMPAIIEEETPSWENAIVRGYRMLRNGVRIERLGPMIISDLKEQPKYKADADPNGEQTYQRATSAKVPVLR